MAAATNTLVRFVVCPADELPPGSRRIIEHDGRTIGVFNLGGQLFALKNVCPHKYAPLCEGPVTGLATGDRPGTPALERAGEIVRCPWHGWEFDIRTGRSVFNPHRVRTKSYPAGFECIEPGGSAAGSVETFTVALEARHVVIYL